METNYAIVYINPADAEPVSAYGPFANAGDAEDAFDDIRDTDENPPEWARTITLVQIPPAHAPTTVDEILANATPVYDDDGKEIVKMAECGHCGRTWNDAAISSLTPTPAARCPYEYEHEPADDRPLYIIENLTQYDLSHAEAETLERMGMIFQNNSEKNDEYERETTAFVWNDLGIEGDTAFDLFDAILGRKGADALHS